MESNLQKERFSDAYLLAVAAAGGFQVLKPVPDVDKTDWQIGSPGPHKTVRSPKVEIQLKCTAREVLKEDHLTFWIDLETYDNLRDPRYHVPRVLVVVVVPDEVTRWLLHCEDNLALHHCGYWYSHRGLPESDNRSGATVHIPRTQQFTVEALRAMMERIGSGGMP